jgi:hypothetical protein
MTDIFCPLDDAAFGGDDGRRTVIAGRRVLARGPQLGGSGPCRIGSGRGVAGTGQVVRALINRWGGRQIRRRIKVGGPNTFGSSSPALLGAGRPGSHIALDHAVDDTPREAGDCLRHRPLVGLTEQVSALGAGLRLQRVDDLRAPPFQHGHRGSFAPARQDVREGEVSPYGDGSPCSVLASGTRSNQGAAGDRP